MTRAFTVAALALLLSACTSLDDRECIDRCIEAKDPEVCYRACMQEREGKADEGEGELALR